MKSVRSITLTNLGVGCQLRRTSLAKRNGKILVLLAIMLPTLLGIAGVVLDGGLIASEQRKLQHAVDAAALAAAMDLRLSKTDAQATQTARDVIQTANGFTDATITVNLPPESGDFQGQLGHVEVIAESTYSSHIMGLLDGVLAHQLRARSVSGVRDVTSGAAIVVLDPNPGQIEYPSSSQLLAALDEVALVDDAIDQLGLNDLLSSVPLIGSTVASLLTTNLQDTVPTEVTGLLDGVIAATPSWSAPALIGGLEVEGAGQFEVDGAILINTEWGSRDEDGGPAGCDAGPPYGIACMPLLPLTSVRARDIRVVGGVDNPDHYMAFAANQPSPLQANRLPVPDPLEDLPVPSSASDANNVVATVHHPADVVKIALPVELADQILDNVYNGLPLSLRSLLNPLLTPIRNLLTNATVEPGVYNSLTVIAPVGGVQFLPGVYIIRGSNPDIGTSLTIVGPVQAEGVMFYITDSADFSAVTGLPDAKESSETSPPETLLSNVPSVLLAPLLPTARITGLDDPTSPLDGMLIFQNRNDRRPMVIDIQQILGDSDISGTIYSKWGHLLFVGGFGAHDLRFVSGTARIVTVTNTTLSPNNLLPAAQDVLLLE